MEFLSSKNKGQKNHGNIGVLPIWDRAVFKGLSKKQIILK